LHGTLVLVVDGAVVVVVEAVVEVVVDEVLLDDVLVEVVPVVAPGGPEWQWFLSPWPNPGRQGAVVDVLVAATPWEWPIPPVMAQAEAPESTMAVTTDTARLNARSDRSISVPLVWAARPSASLHCIEISVPTAQELSNSSRPGRPGSGHVAVHRARVRPLTA
jgi:hypothetical protein